MKVQEYENTFQQMSCIKLTNLFILLF